MRSEAFDFEGEQGQRLAGRLDLPDGPPQGCVLFAHCFTCTRDSRAAVHLARTLAARGLAVLRFDFTGLGESGGEFSESSFSGNVRDLVAAAAALAQRDLAPTLLVGHSFGGAAVLAAAGQIDSVRAVATIAAPYDVEHVARLFPAGIEQVRSAGEAQVDIGGRSFRLGRAFVEDLDQHDQGERIASLRKPLLVMHSPTDTIVDIENATRIFQAAMHPKSFLSLDGADHLLSSAADAEHAGDVIAAWARRYIHQDATPPAHADALVHVAETGIGGFQVEVGIGAARFLADEPVEVGGLGTGPTPYQLLAAALGTCTVMTLRMYARHKSLPLRRISATIGHCKQRGETPADLFTRTLSFDGELDDAQRERLAEIAARCPVHRTLEAGARVQTAADAAALPPAEPAGQHASDMGSATEAR